jgi:hypothetical protein
MPLNVTHLAILTDDLLAKVKGFPGVPSDGSVNDLVPTSPYRNIMSTMLSFFAETCLLLVLRKVRRCTIP